MDSQLKLTINKKKSILVYGYSYQHYQSRIPHDIIKLIINWYDEVLIFNIDHAKLQKFISGENLFSDHFIINNMHFRCALYPKKRFTKFSLQLLMNDNILSVVTYFLMYNSQKDAYWKGKVLFNRDRILSNDDKMETDKENMIWSKRNLPLLECSHFNRLDLNIWPQILSIKYNKKCGVMDYNLDIKIRKTVLFTWTVFKSQLKKWVNCEFQSGFYSDNFPSDNEKYMNWTFNIIPNGVSDSSKGHVMFILDAARMPHNVQYIEVDWKLLTNHGWKCNGHRSFGYGKPWLYRKWKTGRKANMVFNYLSIAQFIIDIKITNVVDWNNNIINKQRWAEYGVVDH